MAKHTVTLIPGDGIGLETTAAMQRVVKAAGADIEWEIAEAGAHMMDACGTPLPESTIEVDVDVVELMGAEIYLYIKSGEETNLIARVSARSTSRAGDKIKVALDVSRIHLFDKDTERYIVH